MATDPLTKTITTTKTIEEARAAVGAYLQQIEATPAGGDDATIEAKTGKKLGTRLVGAWFVSEDWLPLHYAIAFSAGSDGTQVDITLQDDLGVGLRSGFRKKYDALMQRRLGELANALS